MSNPELTRNKSKPNYPNDNFNPNCKTDSSQLKWRQPFNSSIVFLLNLCLIGIVQSMGNSLTFTTTNMLEKRYAYDSKISAVSLNMIILDFYRIHELLPTNR